MDIRTATMITVLCLLSLGQSSFGCFCVRLSEVETGSVSGRQSAVQNGSVRGRQNAVQTGSVSGPVK